MIPKVFRADEHGRAVPEFAEGSDWILKDSNVRMALWLDGVDVRLKQLGPNPVLQRKMAGPNGLVAWVNCDPTFAADTAIWEAFNRERPHKIGQYVCIGPDFKGNPHMVKENQIIRVAPSYDYKLVLYNHGLPVYVGAKVEDLYNRIQKEFEDPQTDVPGVVFMIESWDKGECTITKKARVMMSDFGLSWRPFEAQDTTLPKATVVEKWD